MLQYIAVFIISDPQTAPYLGSINSFKTFPQPI